MSDTGPPPLSQKLDRLLALRGDPKTGVGAAAWSETLGDIDKTVLLRALVIVVRELLIPDWAATRKTDLRPQAALDATEAWLATPTKEVATQAKAAAKGCTEARNETFGQDHRVPEAARHAAWLALGKDPTGLFDALETVEAELLARIALTGEYHRGPEQRRALVGVLRRVLVPPEPKPAPAEQNPVSAGSADPVPYSPEGHFELAQRLTHKKFGEVTVTSVGETWIEVQIPDGTKKRLAHKP